MPETPKLLLGPAQNCRTYTLLPLPSSLKVEWEGVTSYLGTSISPTTISQSTFPSQSNSRIQLAISDPVHTFELETLASGNNAALERTPSQSSTSQNADKSINLITKIYFDMIWAPLDYKIGLSCHQSTSASLGYLSPHVRVLISNDTLKNISHPLSSIHISTISPVWSSSRSRRSYYPSLIIIKQIWFQRECTVLVHNQIMPLWHPPLSAHNTTVKCTPVLREKLEKVSDYPNQHLEIPKTSIELPTTCQCSWIHHCCNSPLWSSNFHLDLHC